MKNVNCLLSISLALLSSLPCFPRAKYLSLREVIDIAKKRSYDAKSARFRFVADYWSFRSFKAELLPSVNLSGSLLNFDHSKVETRNADNGLINYVDNNSLTNSLTLSVDQQLPGLGGTVSLQSYLYRLDQFNYDMTTYNSQPLRITYTQPLRSYNSLKWRKKTAPVEYEIAQREYLEDMERVTVKATQLYFDVVSAQTDYKQSVKNYDDLQKLYEMAQKRFSLGTITKSDILQLELSVLNAKLAVTNGKLNLDNQLFYLFSYLRLSDYEGVELAVPDQIPDMVINVNDAVAYALANSSHVTTQNLTTLKAQQAVAQAHSQKGIQVQLRSELGFNKTDSRFTGAYSNLRDNELIGVSLTLPIFDWGVSKGKVHTAEANLQLAKVQVEQEHEEYLQDIRKQVLQFAYQAELCRTAQRARDISAERYEMTRRRFESGTVTVTDLNTALQEAETAKSKYVSQLQTYWVDYYTLRRVTLYDWQNKGKLTADYNKLLNARYDD